MTAKKMKKNEYLIIPSQKNMHRRRLFGVSRKWRHTNLTPPPPSCESGQFSISLDYEVNYSPLPPLVVWRHLWIIATDSVKLNIFIIIFKHFSRGIIPSIIALDIKPVRGLKLYSKFWILISLLLNTKRGWSLLFKITLRN